MTTPIPKTWVTDDRREVMAPPQTPKSRCSSPGITLCPLAGGHSGEESIYGGVDPGTDSLVSALHSARQRGLVLLEGEASVEVEDRRYRLKQLDAVTVSAGALAEFVNLSTDRCACCIWRWPGQRPSKPGSMAASRWSISRLSATAQLGSEWLCRNDPAARFELAPWRGFRTCTMPISQPGHLWRLWRFRTGRPPPLPPSRVRRIDHHRTGHRDLRRRGKAS